MPALNVALVPAPDRVVVRLTGEADLSTAELLADALAQAGGLGTSRVVVDVARVRFWDCTGLHALADFTAAMARAGRGCGIVGATAATRRLVALAGFSGALELDGLLGQQVLAEPTGPHHCPPSADHPGADGAVAGGGAHGRARVVEHPAPPRRRSQRPRRAPILTVRRWG